MCNEIINFVLARWPNWLWVMSGGEWGQVIVVQVVEGDGGGDCDDDDDLGNGIWYDVVCCGGDGGSGGGDGVADGNDNGNGNGGD